MKTLRVAAVQMCSRENRDQNLAKARTLMEAAVQGGAQLIALPENFSFIGREGEQVKIADDPDRGSSVQFLRSFASQHRVAIVGGSVPLKTAGGSKVTNTCLVFDPSGQLAARYDKLHLFDVSVDKSHTFQESRHTQAGQQAVTVELLDHIMGLSICYDVRFPELYRTLALRGAEVLFVPAAFTVPTGKDHWETLLRARAIENQCYVVASAQFGQHSATRASYGRSMIVDPWGQILRQCQDKEAVILCEIDFELLGDVRRRLPSLEHARRGNLFPTPETATTSRR